MVFEITSSWLLLLGLFSISTLNCGSISEGFQYKTFAIKIRRFHHIFRWFSKGIESLPQTLILYPYIFGTQCRKSLIFQTCIIWSNRIHSLKYLRSTTLESEDIGFRKAEFVAKTQFLLQKFNVLKITFCNSEHMQKSYLGSCHKKLDRIGWEVLRLGYERTNR